MNKQDSLVINWLSRAPRMPGTFLGLVIGWVVIVGGYCLVSLTVAPGRGLTAFGDTFQRCV